MKKYKIAFIFRKILGSWVSFSNPIRDVQADESIGGFKNFNELSEFINVNKLEFYQIIQIPEMKCFEIEADDRVDWQDLESIITDHIRNKYGRANFNHWIFSEDGKNLPFWAIQKPTKVF